MKKKWLLHLLVFVLVFNPVYGEGGGNQANEANASIAIPASSLPGFCKIQRISSTDFAFEVSLDRPDAIYRKGEEIKVSCRMLFKDKPARNEFMRCDSFVNGVFKARQIVSGEGTATITGRLDEPGWFAVIVTAMDESQTPIPIPGNRWGKAISGGIGAMVSPSEILPSGKEPDDFNTFWEAQRSELKKVPIRAIRTEVPVPKHVAEKVICFDVKVDCAGDMPVSGYLVVPRQTAPKSLPALVSFNGYGFFGSYQPLGWAGKLISFNVNAHGIENGRDDDFYRELSRGKLRDYPQQGKESRDTFYFRGMYLRAMRALDYIKSLPEWDGKTLIVIGNSQGGGQAIAAAGLDSDVTLCIAGVPGLGDHAGWSAGRKPGWPELCNVKDGKSENEKIQATAEYFDNNNFARRIRCETYLSTGFIDFICAPTSVYSVYNSLPSGVRKHLDTAPDSGHFAPKPSGEHRLEMLFGRN